jgi:hypothetical protein
MSSEDGKGYSYGDGDFQAIYWADATLDGHWQAFIESSYTLSAELQAGGVQLLPRMYATEHEALSDALERIQGEVIWWRRRNDVYQDGTHRDVAYRVIATRLGQEDPRQWKCVVQYDKPLQNGAGTQYGEFLSPNAAIEYGVSMAQHVIAGVLDQLEADPGT